jgi:nitroreductase/FMN reductase [NAD(P)H]
VPTIRNSERLRVLRAERFATTLDEGPDGSGLDEFGDADTATIELMLDHRTCRRFSERLVGDDVLDLLLAATFSTPSKSDLQQCSVIVVDDPASRAVIAELIPAMPWVAESPRFLVFCGDSRRIRRIADEAGVVFANDHLDAFLNAAADAAMHLSSFVWAAESLGLGTCPISVVRNHIDEVSEILGLPDHVFPLAGMCVGWPDRPERLSPRLPMSVTVHRDRYHDDDAPALIADYDRRRSGAQPKGADWSVAKATMVAHPERTQLAQFLRRRGFRLD